MRLLNREARLGLLVGLVLVLCGVSGGSSFLLIKSLVTQVTPLQLVAGRVALAALVLVPALLLTRRFPTINGSLLRDASILAVIDVVVPFTLIALAAAHILASTSALLVSTMPLFTALFVTVADRTRVAAGTLVGLALGVLGVLVVAGPSALDFGSSSTLGMFAVVLAAGCFAAAAVYSRLPLRTTDPIGLSAVKFAIAGAIVVPAVVLQDGVGSFIDLDRAGWLSLLGVGVITTAVVRCGYVWVISVAGSVRASLLTYITPAAALILALMFTGETMSWSKGFGVALIAASVTCVLFGGLAVEALRPRRLGIDWSMAARRPWRLRPVEVPEALPSAAGAAEPDVRLRR